MKLISWNCQGLGNPLTIQALRALVAREQPDILFLMETKNGEQVLRKLQKQLTYTNGLLEQPLGIAGGLAVFWKDHIYLTLDQQTPDYIDMFCAEGESGPMMRLTCLHAPAVFQPRQSLWRAFSCS